MGRHNAFAQKIALSMAVLKEEERRAIVRRCIDTCYYAAAIANNRAFHIGRTREPIFKEDFLSVLEEYGVLMHGADVDYADDKLEEAYKRIMER